MKTPAPKPTLKGQSAEQFVQFDVPELPSVNPQNTFKWAKDLRVEAARFVRQLNEALRGFAKKTPAAGQDFTVAFQGANFRVKRDTDGRFWFQWYDTDTQLYYTPGMKGGKIVRTEAGEV